MTKIITYTLNPALDVTTLTDVIEPNEKVRCEKPEREPGGGGVNVSRALKRLGADSTAVYTKGGATGELYEQLISEEGIDQITIPITSTMRENIAVQEKESKEMYRFVFPGAELKEQEWQQFLEKIPDFHNVKYLVASGSLPPGAPEDFYARLSLKAKEHGIKFILDTSKKPLKAILESGAYLIKPNEKELVHLTGKEATNEEEQLKSAEEIVKNYDIEVVVVSLGPKGAILATREGVVKLPSPSIQKKDSAVGAGDSMVAGIVCSLSKEDDIRKAVMYGVACGSAALMTPGTELVYKEDADKLFEQMQNVEV